MLHIGGETATDMASTEEAWTVLSEVLRVIENGTKVMPTLLYHASVCT